jgi:hypothetical protein
MLTHIENERLRRALREIAQLATQDISITAPLAGRILLQIEIIARKALRETE